MSNQPPTTPNTSTTSTPTSTKEAPKVETDKTMDGVNKAIGEFNTDIGAQKIRLENVNKRLEGVADKIKGFTASGGEAAKKIEEEIAKIKADAATKKTAAADKVTKGLGAINLDELKKTIGQIGVVSVQIKSAVASDDGDQMEKDVRDIMPLLKSIKDETGKLITVDAVKKMFPKVVLDKLEAREKGLFDKIFVDTTKQEIGGRKKRKQTKKRRKIRRK